MERCRDVGQVLGRAVETEPPDDDLALPLGQGSHGDGELRELFSPRRVAWRIDRSSVGEQLVERRLERRPRGRGASCHCNALEWQAERAGDLERRRSTAFAGRELRFGPVDGAPPLDDVLWQPHEPGRLRDRIADCAPDLETGKALEVAAACGIEHLDRIEQPDASLLHEVVEGDVQPAVMRCQRPDGRQVLFDEALTGAAIASHPRKPHRVVCAHHYPIPRYACGVPPASGRTTDRRYA